MRRIMMRRIAGRSVLHIVLVLLCIAWLVPSLSLFANSLRTDVDVAASGWWTILWSPAITLDNYTGAFQNFDLAPSLINSLVIAAPVAIATALLSAVSAYAFALMRFPGRDVLFVIVLALVAVPPQVVLVPLLKVLQTLGLSGQMAPLWVIETGFGLPFGILLLRASFLSIPTSLLEAAEIDGASRLSIFLRVVLPLSLPSLIAIGVFQFLWAWNELLFPLVFIGGQSDSTPISVQIAGLVQTTGQGESLVAAATVASIALPLVIFFVLQRYFVRGLTAGAVKD